MSLKNNAHGRHLLFLYMYGHSILRMHVITHKAIMSQNKNFNASSNINLGVKLFSNFHHF